MNKKIEKDYIEISKDDFEEIYGLIQDIEFNEERLSSDIVYVHDRLDLLDQYIRYSKLKRFILKYILKIDLEKELKEAKKHTLGSVVKYLFWYNRDNIEKLKEKLEKIKNEKDLNNPYNESKHG